MAKSTRESPRMYLLPGKVDFHFLSMKESEHGRRCGVVQTSISVTQIFLCVYVLHAKICTAGIILPHKGAGHIISGRIAPVSLTSGHKLYSTFVGAQAALLDPFSIAPGGVLELSSRLTSLNTLLHDQSAQMLTRSQLCPPKLD